MDSTSSSTAAGSESIAKSNDDLIETCNNISRQLQNILKTPNVLNDNNNDDNTILQGFILFQHTKLTQLLLPSSSSNNSSDGFSLNSKKISRDSKVLEFSWNFIHNPILKFFIKQKKKILVKYNITTNNNKKLRENVQCIVELRKLNNKFNKLIKKFMDFYSNLLWNNLQLLNTNSDLKCLDLDVDYLWKLCTSYGLPSNNSGVSKHNNTNGINSTHSTDSDPQFLKDVLKNCFQLSLSIAQVHKFTVLMESISYKIVQFQPCLNWCRVSEYLSMILWKNNCVLDKYTSQYMIMSKCYLKAECFGYAAYYMIKTVNTCNMEDLNSTTDTTSNGQSLIALQNLNSLLKMDSLPQYLGKLDVMNKDKNNRLIINKEIIENYFLYCWSVNFSPENITDKNDNGDFDNSIYQYRKNILFEKISIRYKKNIVPIFLNLIICIGGFNILLSQKSNGGSDSNSKDCKFVSDLPDSKLNYLNFCFEYINFVLENVILKEFEYFQNAGNFGCNNNSSSSSSGSNNNQTADTKIFQKDYQYIAFIRVILGWCKSSKLILQYVHRNYQFNSNLSKLINLFLKYDTSLYDFQKTGATHRPKRLAVFLEDYQLTNLKCFQLNDFNDSQLVPINNESVKLCSFLETQDVCTSQQRFQPHNKNTNSNHISNNIGTSVNTNNTLFIADSEFTLKLQSLVYNSKKIISGNLVNVILQPTGSYGVLTPQSSISSRNNSILDNSLNNNIINNNDSNNSHVGSLQSDLIWNDEKNGSNINMSARQLSSNSMNNSNIYSGGSFTLSGALESTLSNAAGVASSMNNMLQPQMMNETNYQNILQSYAHHEQPHQQQQQQQQQQHMNSNPQLAYQSRFFHDTLVSQQQTQGPPVTLGAYPVFNQPNSVQPFASSNSFNSVPGYSNQASSSRNNSMNSMNSIWNTRSVSNNGIMGSRSMSMSKSGANVRSASNTDVLNTATVTTSTSSNTFYPLQNSVIHPSGKPNMSNMPLNDYHGNMNFNNMNMNTNQFSSQHGQFGDFYDQNKK